MKQLFFRICQYFSSNCPSIYVHLNPIELGHYIVKQVYAVLHTLRVKVHPDKTFIIKVTKVFYLGGLNSNTTGLSVSQTSLSRRDKKITRLYDERGVSKRRVGLYLAQWFCWFWTSMGVAGYCVYAHGATECVSTGLEAHYNHPDYDPYSICKCLLPNGSYISLQVRFNSNGKILESRNASPHIDNNSGGVHTYINTRSTTLPQQKYYCVWHTNLGYSSASLTPPNGGSPNIHSLSIPANNLKVGETATATITVSSDSDDYTAGSGSISGTIGGFTVSNLSRTNDTTYTATFTITEGGTDVPSGSDIPVSIKLTDSAGNQMANAFTTAISQNGDAIDANKPTLAEITAITTPTTDTTPTYTFSTNETGTITYSGDCSSNTTNATNSNNSITFNTLALGTHSNCTITVTDSADNVSNSLAVTAFTIAYSVNTVPNIEIIDEDTPLIFSTTN